MAVGNAMVHAWCSCRLYTPYLHGGIEALYGIGNTTGKASAADGNDDALDIGQLVKEFKTYGSLSCYHLLVIEGMHESVAVLIAQLQRMLIGIVVNSGHQADFRAITACCLHLADGSTFGKTDE